MTQRHLLVLVAVVGLLGAGAVFGLTDSGETRQSQETASVIEAPAAQSTPWEEMQQRMEQAGLPARGGIRTLAQSFAALRGPAARMPLPVQDEVRAAIGAPPGALDLDRAHLLDTRHGRVWVVAGKGLACVVQATDYAFACEALRGTSKRGLIVGTVTKPTSDTAHGRRFSAIGIVPDGFSWARLETPSGVAGRRAVRGNVISARSREPVSIQPLR